MIDSIHCVDFDMRAIKALREGKAKCVGFLKSGKSASDDELLLRNVAIMPGSFNPLHRGHLACAEIAREFLAKRDDLVFEISMEHPNKGLLDDEEVSKRVSQFEGRTVVVTRAPLYVDKAKIFPNSTFVIGADTFERIVDPKYYGDKSIRAMKVVLDSIRACKCDFLVVGRKNSDTGVFETAEMILKKRDKSISDCVKGMFSSIPEKAFRVDLSSTEIRNQKKNEKN